MKKEEKIETGAIILLMVSCIALGLIIGAAYVRLTYDKQMQEASELAVSELGEQLCKCKYGENFVYDGYNNPWGTEKVVDSINCKQVSEYVIEMED